MKSIISSKVLRKVVILFILVLGVCYVGFNDASAQAVNAAPCCSSCPWQPGGGESVEEYCSASCGNATSKSCYINCKRTALNCVAICIECNGSGE